MSQKNDKKLRRVVNKKVARDNQAVFQAFMLEISAQSSWQRCWFCARMAFKRHELQKSMKDQITARKRLLKAHKVAAGADKSGVLSFVFCLAYILILVGLMIGVGG